MNGGEAKRDYAKLCVLKWAVGRKVPDAQLDQWAITIRYEDEDPG
jgi:hypothetical protein